MPKPGQAAGMIGAARLALIASYSGVKDVRYLDGPSFSFIDDGLHRSSGSPRNGH